MKTVAAGFAALVLVVVVAEPGAAPAAQRFPRTYRDLGITLLDEWVTDVDLSADGTRLAYARRDPRDWYLDIWTSRPSGREQACLTCEVTAPLKHRGAPAWHPDGEWLVFSAENDDVRTRKADRMAEPATALNTNLWALSVAAAKASPLTTWPTDYKDPRGALAPIVSPDGKRVAWSGPVGRQPDEVKGGTPTALDAHEPRAEWGRWAVFLADLELDGDAPILRDVRALTPGDQGRYYQVDDWSADGRRLLLTSVSRGQPLASLDIYEYDLATERMRRLVQSSDWDHHAHYSADGRQIVWASSRGLNVRFRSVEGLNWRRDIRTDLWVMNRDGSESRRLTFFNERGHRDHAWFRSRVFRTPRVFVSDSACLLDGSRVAAVLGYEASAGQLGGVLAVLDLER
jgi:Tol biopolymer transport system component